MRLLPILLLAGFVVGCVNEGAVGPEAVRTAGAAGSTTTSTPAGASAVLRPAEWTEHWDCGHRFTAANAEGTQQLVVEPGAAAAVAEPSTVALPSPLWRAYVQIGEHFGARGFTEGHACTDLGRVEDPEPRIDEEWQVIDGTLIVEPEPLEGFPGTAGLTANGLVVELPDGATVTLDRIQVVSNCWGCAAG